MFYCHWLREQNPKEPVRLLLDTVCKMHDEATRTGKWSQFVNDLHHLLKHNSPDVSLDDKMKIWRDSTDDIRRFEMMYKIQ